MEEIDFENDSINGRTIVQTEVLINKRDLCATETPLERCR